MVRAELTNNRTASIDTNHSAMFTLLLELNLICEERCLNCKIVPLRQNVHYHLANLWNQITTIIFDIFRIITLKQQKFSQSDPVRVRQLSKKLQSDPVLIRAHLWFVWLMRQNKMNDFTWADQSWIGLMIFKNFAHRTGLGLKNFTVRSSLMGSSCQMQLSQKECAIGAACYKKEGMFLQPLGWRCVECANHHERDAHKR